MTRPIVRGSSLEHDWAADGWEPFIFRRLSADGTQAFTKSVVAGRGRWAPTLGSNGGYRELALLRSAYWADGEIEALIWGPNVFNAGSDRPQMGLVARAVLDPGNAVRAYAGWYDITVPFPQVVNRNAVQGTAAGALVQGTGANTDYAAQLDKSVRILASARIDAFDVAQHSCRELWDLRNGDLVNITGMNPSTLNATGVAVSAVDPDVGFFQVADTTAGDVALAVQAGTAVQTVQPRITFPYVLGLRVVGGVVTTRVSRYGEDPPDWGAATGVASSTPTAGFALPAGKGFWGLWLGHGVAPNYGEFGWVRARQL